MLLPCTVACAACIDPFWGGIKLPNVLCLSVACAACIYYFPERKAKMLELGDAFIAFPGGTGTLEEIAEVMSRVALGQLDAPCIFYNLNGYYDGLRTLLAHMIEPLAAVLYDVPLFPQNL